MELLVKEGRLEAAGSALCGVAAMFFLVAMLGFLLAAVGAAWPWAAGAALGCSLVGGLLYWTGRRLFSLAQAGADGS